MPVFDETPFRHSLPVPNWLFDEPIYVTHAGWERIEPDQAYPLTQNQLYSFDYDVGRSLPEFTLGLLADGAGELETTEQHQSLTRGEAFLFVPGQWHRHRPLAKSGWTLYWVHFSGNLPHSWLKDATFRLDGCKLIIDDPSLFLAQFERILLSAHRFPTDNSLDLSRQAIGLCSHFLADASKNRPKIARQPDDVVNLAIDFIWNHSHAEFDIEVLAKNLQVCRRTLERHFRYATGHTLHEEIQTCRVERAKRLLIETDIPIKEVVFRSGFNTREQLRQAFIKSSGLSPAAFRQQKAARDGQ